MAQITREEAITKANALLHRMSAFVQEQHGGEIEDWPYKFRSTCDNCGEIMVHSFVPDELESILGNPLDNLCIKSYGLPGFPPEEQKNMRIRTGINQPEPEG